MADRQENQSIYLRKSKSLYNRVVKRFLDICLGLIGLPIVGIHLLIFAPIIYLEDKGPVFYNAPRVGRFGKTFLMYKYRTMHVNAPDIKEADGSTYNAPDDPRQTKIGVFLRKTSMDEFPQLINVLKGDMSFIGPRPDLEEEAALYEGNDEIKLLVRPGISGYAQVYGRNAIPWRERLHLDANYVGKLSFALDTRIFLRTFFAVFGQKDIYVAGQGELQGELQGETQGEVQGEVQGETQSGAQAGAQTGSEGKDVLGAGNLLK
jgi:lipopolysaccharide/colanic/teichoic acid biosynthesis glycosyltransferase